MYTAGPVNEAGAVKMLVTGVDSRGGIAKVQLNGSLIVGRGGYVSLSAFGMTPGATGEIIVMSTPRVLGTFVVAEDGSFTGQVRLPDDIEGEHTVTLVAGSVVVSLGVEVATTRSVEGVAQGGTLPMSGSDSMPVSLMALLLIGVVLLIKVRHRRFHVREIGSPLGGDRGRRPGGGRDLGHRL